MDHTLSKKPMYCTFIRKAPFTMLIATPPFIFTHRHSARHKILLITFLHKNHE